MPTERVKPLLYAILSYFFPLEVIDENYLVRWIIKIDPETREGWYLHHTFGDDPSPHLHDHPKRFLSIGLFGSYVEEADLGSHRFTAPWVRRFPATYRHRLLARNCWTLCRVGPVEREWGFWVRGEFVHWTNYARPGNPLPRLGILEAITGPGRWEGAVPCIPTIGGLFKIGEFKTATVTRLYGVDSDGAISFATRDANYRLRMDRLR